MPAAPAAIEQFSHALITGASEFGVQLADEDIARLSSFYELLLKWNSRLHLVAPCSPEEFATRHVLESLFALRHVSRDARLIDVGTGAGLPSIPCLMVRDDLHATLIESSAKKAVFLREALRLIPNPGRAQLVVKRFAETSAPLADFVTCRAIDRFAMVLPQLVTWAPAGCTLLLFAGTDLRKQIEGLLPDSMAELIPGSEQRFLVAARR